jgi:hypothetical protein
MTVENYRIVRFAVGASSLVASFVVVGLLIASLARAADSLEVCLDEPPDPRAFVISAISLEGIMNSGALSDVYFSVKNVAGPDVRYAIRFLAVFSKRGEVVKTARFDRYFLREPLRRGDVEQIRWAESRIGGFCDANMSGCGSVTVRVVGVCYVDPRGPKGK